MTTIPPPPTDVACEETKVTRFFVPANLILAILLGILVLSCNRSDDSSADRSGGQNASPTSTIEDGSQESATPPEDGKTGSTDKPNKDPENDGTSDQDHSSASGHAHGHALKIQEIAEGLPVPTVAIEVLKDPKSGWNLRVETTNFRLAPENVSTEDVDGEGHLHLYINGEKITRLYSHRYHIGELEPGEHDIEVVLNSNTHGFLAIDGEPISASRTIHVPDPDDDSSW